MTKVNTARKGFSAGYFYVAPDAIDGDVVALSHEEAKHASKVLRLGVGDEIPAVDGRGGWYRIKITAVGRSGLLGRIVGRATGVGEPDFQLTVGIGILSNAGRFETFLEKAVELGVSRIIPMTTERGRSGRVNVARAGRVMIAGMKQCMRSSIPVLEEPRSFGSVLADDSMSSPKLVAAENAGAVGTPFQFTDAIREGRSCSILIGPEGGFTEDEIGLAKSSGWSVVTLGAGRLRAETAAIVAAAAVRFICTEK